MVAIVDYGMGNLRSVWKAFRHLGADARLTDDPHAVAAAQAVVLPGVGAFGDCMSNLARLGLIPPILGAIRSGKPYLGICLGLQILFEESDEFGFSKGLGVLAGSVARFPSRIRDPETGQETPLKVPHIGWNDLELVGEAPHLRGLPPGAHFYFVHSYFVRPRDPGVVATTTKYGVEFVSSVRKGNLFACQFHPEKSQEPGLRLLRNFLDLL
jgi:glutamine amidotransferase